MGDWDAIWSDSGQDSFGNVQSNHAHAIDCRDSLLRSESKGQELIGLGLDKIVAISMSDAVLVAHKDKAQDVKQVVDYLTECVSGNQTSKIIGLGDGLKVLY